jgi:2-dehydropantoate 2-reductase
MQHPADIREIVIVGAGAMGCLFAARLLEAGAAVTLIDNNLERLKLIQEQGLELIDDAGSRRVQPRTALAQRFSGPVDLLMLFTKGVHSAAAVASVAHLAAGRPIALTLQNGLGNAEILAAAFGADRVLMGTAHVPADLQPPNKVISHGFAHLHLGGHVPAAHGLADPVAALLTRSGFQSTVAADIARAVWEKLAFNAALNATAMVAQASNGEMNNQPGRRVAHAVVLECVAVARAVGIDLDAGAIDQTIERALSEHPGHRASMLQDRENSRPGEIETLNGAIVRIGAEKGVPTPVNATLADLVRLIEGRMAR